MLKRNRKDAGFVTLLSELVGLAVLLILATMAFPTVTTYIKMQQAQAALQAMHQIQTANSWYEGLYNNGFASNVSFLMGVPATQRTCDNPRMLNSGIVPSGSTMNGYTFSFSHVGATQVALAPGCTNPGWTTYQFTAVLTAGGCTKGRSFYLDPVAGIHYADGGSSCANASSPVWTGQ